jgi:hypothetical protein
MADKTLEELAGEEFDTRMVVEGLAQMNTYGLTYEEQKKQAIEYAIAKERHTRANRLLWYAINEPAQEAK